MTGSSETTGVVSTGVVSTGVVSTGVVSTGAVVSTVSFAMAGMGNIPNTMMTAIRKDSARVFNE